MNSKLKIVFFGTPVYVDPILTAIEQNFDLVGAFRTQQFNDETMEQLRNLNPDLFVVASFGKIFPESVLKIPRLGSINVHPSKLPKYRGPSPLQEQILDGVKDSAISFILMDSEVDHGPILHQEPFQILDTDTFESLCEKMFAKSAQPLTEIINSFSDGSVKGVVQDDKDATFTKLIEKEDGYFDIENPPDSQTLDRMIRAYYTWPAAWTKWKNKIIKFLPPEPKSQSSEPFLVQMEGKNVTDLKSFLNGHPEFPLA